MISPETIAVIRERTDILAVVTEHVPSLRRRGRSFVGLCPFHKEKTPSFHVNPDRGFFHCFGCKESGSAIDFVMKLEGSTFPEAVRALAERAGIEIERSSAPAPEIDRQRRQKEDLYAVSQLAAVFFEAQLREHPEREYALAELDRRGLRPSWAGGRTGEAGAGLVDDTVQAFRLGYAPPQWDGLAQFLRAQGVSSMAAESVGLLVPRSSGAGHYDRFRHRLMFAVVDPQGRVVAFSGRALPPLPEERTSHISQDRADAPPKYLNSPESPIYTKGHTLFGIHQARHAIRSEGEAIVVEGNFDVVSLHARGITNVVAPLGTAFTLEQAKLLRRFAPGITLLFDGDAAGKKAARLSREPSRDAGLSVKVATLPEGTDPDEIVRRKGETGIRELLDQSKGMLEYLIDCEFDETFTSADAHERVKRVERIVQLLREEKDPLVHSMAKTYADQVAGRLDIVRSPEAFRALEHSVRRALAQAPPRLLPAHRQEVETEPAPDDGRPPPGTRPKDARISPKVPGAAERRAMVGALIEHPSLLGDPAVCEALGGLSGPSVQLVSALRRAWDPTHSRLDTGEFLAQIDKTFHIFVASRIAGPTHESEDDAKRDLLENANKLKRLLLTQEHENLARENYKPDNDWETSTELAREADQRVRARMRGLKSR